MNSQVIETIRLSGGLNGYMPEGARVVGHLVETVRPEDLAPAPDSSA